MLLTLASSAAHARTAESQSDLGTATALWFKMRANGALLTSGPESPSAGVAWRVAGAAAGTVRVMLWLSRVGTDAYIGLGNSSGSTLAMAIVPVASLGSSSYFRVYAHAGPSGFLTEIYNESGTLIGTGSASGITLPSAGADRGYVLIGQGEGGTGLPGPVGALDGLAIGAGTLSGATRIAAPHPDDAGLLWLTVDDAGNLVDGATDLEDYSGATWGAGGEWNRPSGDPTYTGALSGAAGAASGAFSGAYTAPTYTGGLSGTAAAASGGFAGSYAAAVVPGVIGGQASAATGGFAGAYEAPIVGALGGQASAASGSFAGEYAYQGIWGVLGDSNSDEYNANDNRPAFNWTEMLAAPSTGAPSLEHIRGLDLGSWGTRSEPRRTGYANNYARSGSTMVDVLADQLSPMAARVTNGEITHVVLFGTGNEWGNPFQDFYIDRIYNGNGTLDSEGANVEGLMDAVAARYATAMDTLVGAGLIGGMVVVTIPRWDLFPVLLLNYTNATRLGYVGAAVQYCNGLIEAHAASVNATAGREVVVTTPLDAIWSEAYATDDGTHMTIAGVPLIYTSDAANGEPNYFAIAPQTAIPHPGTIAQGALANTVIAAANELPGVYIEPFSDAEIRENAGIASEASGTLAGTAQAASGSFTGAYAVPEYTGALSGTAGDAAGAFSGAYAAPTYAGTLSGTAGAAAGDFTGAYAAPEYAGTLGGQAVDASSTFSGAYAVPTYSGALGGTAAAAQGTFTATYSAPAGVIGGQAGPATGSFIGAYSAPTVTGTLGGAADPATGAFAGAYVAPVGGVLAGASAPAFGSFEGTYAPPEYAGVLAGVAGAADGAFGGSYYEPGIIVGHLRGTAGAASGMFAGSYEAPTGTGYFSSATFRVRPALTARIR